MGLVNKLKNSKAKGLFYAALLSSAVLAGCKDNANGNSNNNDNTTVVKMGSFIFAKITNFS